MRSVRLLTLALCLSGAGISNGATLVLTDGKLSGARGVDIGGALYDVNFLGGSGYDAYGADLSGFFFDTATQAQAASQALADQVFTGAYDTNPLLTYGVTGVQSFAAFATAYASFVPAPCAFCYPSPPYLRYSRFVNGATEQQDSIQAGSHLASTNLPGYYFYADWSAADVSPVPLPGALGLMLSGLGGLLAMQRRRKAEVSPTLSPSPAA